MLRPSALRPVCSRARWLLAAVVLAVGSPLVWSDTAPPPAVTAASSVPVSQLPQTTPAEAAVGFIEAIRRGTVADILRFLDRESRELLLEEYAGIDEDIPLAEVEKRLLADFRAIVAELKEMAVVSTETLDANNALVTVRNSFTDGATEEETVTALRDGRSWHVVLY